MEGRKKKYIAVAKYIINKKKEVSIMELLKLSYIAHGYSLAVLDYPLIDCPIEAWPLGPVPVDMYHYFRRLGIDIKEKAANELFLNDSPDNEITDPDEKNIIDTVIEKYKNATAYELSGLTHNEGTPWTNTVREKGFYKIITDEDIKSYYKKFL